jgi:hypothetical protein
MSKYSYLMHHICLRFLHIYNRLIRQMLSINLCQLDYYYAFELIFITFNDHFLDFAIQICFGKTFRNETPKIKEKNCDGSNSIEIS